MALSDNLRRESSCLFGMLGRDCSLGHWRKRHSMGWGRRISRGWKVGIQEVGEEGIQEVGMTVLEQEYDLALEPLGVYVYSWDGFLSWALALSDNSRRESSCLSGMLGRDCSLGHWRRWHSRGWGGRISRGLKVGIQEVGEEGIQEVGMTVLEQEYDLALVPLGVYVYSWDGFLPWALERMTLKGLGRKDFKWLEGRYSRVWRGGYSRGWA